MKKALSLIWVLALCLSLCACGGKKTSTVIDNLGNSKELTAKELVSLKNENEPKFVSLYENATIKGTATVDKVESVGSHGISIISTDKDAYRITTKEGWIITVLISQHEDVIEYTKGDKIQFSSKIDTVFINRLWISDYSESASKDYTELKVID